MKHILQASTLFMLLSSFASAQTAIEVPFEFKVGEMAMPAGQYTFKSASTTASSGAFFLRNGRTGKTVLINAPVPMFDPAMNGRRMVFKCQSGCQLMELWPSSGYGGARMRPSPAAATVEIR